MKKKLSVLTIISLLLFYLSWAIPQILAQKMNNSYLPDLLFSTVFTGITGCLVPFIFKNRFDLTYNQNSPNRIFGLIILFLTVLFGIVGSGALMEAIRHEYSIVNIVKYVLLFIPMSLALCLFAFHLIPNAIDKSNIKFKNVITVISIGLFFFVGFVVDTVFEDFELAGIMGLLGVLFGLSYIFLRNFWIVYSGFFVTMLINTLAENKYDNHLFWIVILSTLISVMIIGYDFIRNRQKTLHNKRS